MNLIYSASGDVNLTAQLHEIKVIVRKAITLMTANLIFIDGYPDSPTQAAWAQKVLISAANTFKLSNANSQRVVARYDSIMLCLRQDLVYLSALSRLVCGIVCLMNNS